MHLLVALGNIGPEYEITRHNFGFLLLDQLIEDYGFNQVAAKKFHSEIFSGMIDGQKVIAIKPQTFMNRSGIAASEVANFYKIDPDNIIAFHDDVDLELGRMRAKVGGGNAGHNGLKSLDSHMGKKYTKVRLGVGRPQDSRYSTADYVLGKFSKDELEAVKKVNLKISDVMEDLLEGKLDEFMNKFYL